MLIGSRSSPLLSLRCFSVFCLLGSKHHTPVSQRKGHGLWKWHNAWLFSIGPAEMWLWLVFKQTNSVCLWPAPGGLAPNPNSQAAPYTTPRFNSDQADRPKGGGRGCQIDFSKAVRFRNLPHVFLSPVLEQDSPGFMCREELLGIQDTNAWGARRAGPLHVLRSLQRNRGLPQESLRLRNRSSLPGSKREGAASPWRKALLFPRGLSKANVSERSSVSAGPQTRPQHKAALCHQLPIHCWGPWMDRVCVWRETVNRRNKAFLKQKVCGVLQTEKEGVLPIYQAPPCCYTPKTRRSFSFSMSRRKRRKLNNF